MEKLKITLAYANAPVLLTTNDVQQAPHNKQHILSIEVPKDTNIYRALQLSDWLTKFDELQQWCEQIKAMDSGLDTLPIAKDWRVGVYSKKQALSYVLKNKDRIEIYRPLGIDPMKKRRAKVKKSKNEDEAQK